MGARVSARYLVEAERAAADGITYRQAISALVLATLAHHGWNKTRAARQLGIQRRKIYHLLETAWDDLGVKRRKERSLADYWIEATTEPT